MNAPTRAQRSIQVDIARNDRLGPGASRYHPGLVVLHWFLAFGIVFVLFLGFVGVARIPNNDPAKIAALRGHVIQGIAVLVLMAVRLAVRLRTNKPPAATTGSLVLDRLALATHYGFYILIFAMVGTGLATAISTGVLPIVYGEATAPLPSTFLVYDARVAHGIIAWGIVVFLALHVIGAVYHQFVRKDRLLRRMWIGEDRVG